MNKKVERLNFLVKYAENSIHNVHRKKAKKTKLAAAVYYKGKRISLGLNNDKTAPIVKDFSHLIYTETEKKWCPPTQHAEIDAILKAKRIIGDLTGCTLYIAHRNQNTGCASLACPCNMCRAIAIREGISKIIYTVDENNYVEEKITSCSMSNI